jgi:CDP-diacylglycerol---serine O-phosphatidyltransferase
MRLRKLMFVLPNLFTVSSIFCGFYAITLCAGQPTPTRLHHAALAILFAFFFDSIDGRVARLTKTQSEFGIELDSLADVISFGVAPAMLIYEWALAPFGFTGLFISFAFAACGALRLARFNVLARRGHGGASRYFVGLPIPLAAGVIVSMVVAQYGTHGAELSDASRLPVAVVVVALSLLMVSTVRYRTFKDLRLDRRTVVFMAGAILAAALVGSRLHPSWWLAACFFLYLTFGLLESTVLLRQRLVARRLGRVAAAAALVAQENEEGTEG